jgi:hypothetical protein
MHGDRQRARILRILMHAAIIRLNQISNEIKMDSEIMGFVTRAAKTLSAKRPIPFSLNATSSKSIRPKSENLNVK